MKNNIPLTALEEILLAFPHAQYENGSLFQEDRLVCDKADDLISGFYDDFDSLNPRGADYIDTKFHGSFKDAFDCVTSYTRILD